MAEPKAQTGSRLPQSAQLNHWVHKLTQRNAILRRDNRRGDRGGEDTVHVLENQVMDVCMYATVRICYRSDFEKLEISQLLEGDP